MPTPGPDKIDLDAYCERIGYSGSRAPTLDTLRAIHLHHPQAIPFENLDPFLRRPVLLDSASLEAKLVRNGRGGWCFEHNLLLRHVLESLGFRVTGHAARMLWNVPEGVIRHRSHMLLSVELDGVLYIADVGFGGLTLTAPLRLVAGVEQATPHERFRLLARDGDFVLQALLRDEWRPLYRFDLQRQLLPDYEVTNWYLANHPQSHLVTGLMCAMASVGRRYALRDNQLSVHRLNGDSEQRTLSNAAELRAALRDVFRIRLPSEPQLDGALEQLLLRRAGC